MNQSGKAKQKMINTQPRSPYPDSQESTLFDFQKFVFSAMDPFAGAGVVDRFGLISNDARQFYEWVVAPLGQLKQVRYSTTVTSYLLNVEWLVNDVGRRSGVETVDLKPRYKRLGWSLLRDDYRFWYQDSPDAAKTGYKVVSEFLRATQDASKRPYVARKTVPDKYWPPTVLARRQKVAEILQGGDFEPADG